MWAGLGPAASEARAPLLSAYEAIEISAVVGHGLRNSLRIMPSFGGHVTVVQCVDTDTIISFQVLKKE